MTVRIITVGTLKEKYLSDAMTEYGKRISQYARLETVELREERIQDEDDATEVSRALTAEGERILAAAPRDSYRVALCVEGREVSSEELAAVVARAKDTCGKLTLIIGSSHGLSGEVKEACDARISFSRLTFPHQLMRVILSEALYRSFTIIAGKRYHK